MKIYRIYDFPFRGEEQKIILSKGTYLFECWGASAEAKIENINSDRCSTTKGRGAYTKGFIQLNETKTFYVYVGEKGSRSKQGPIFNSNNNTTPYQGGGSTDIRLSGGSWFLFDSLKSRIMVAGAAGSGENYCGGDGGTISGISNSATAGTQYYTTSGTQTSGGIAAHYRNDNGYLGHGTNGTFGMSGDGYCNDINQGLDCDPGAGGGSGYYGSGGTVVQGSGSGGSSFISGHPECDAISIDSTEDHIIHSGQPTHYSNISFFKTEMIAGNQEMISPDHQLVIGNEGNGFARITQLTPFFLTCKRSYQYPRMVSYYVFIIIK